MMATNVLTKAELRYIHKLMRTPCDASNKEGPGFHIDGGGKANALLLQLAAQTRLTFEAQFDEFCMSFPLQLNEDEFHNLRLQLAPPTIYERGPTMRTWRLQLEQPLPLLEEDGEESPLSVHELSPDSLVVDTSHKRRAPRHFHLQLALPGEGSLQINARRISEARDGMAAYEVEFPEGRDAERVRSFLYAQHQKLHPELQPELPDDLVN
ncbi:PilZ domain-containing protein [Stutzerimonas kirkiae]|uniref:PilZ domain-containing protein n=1 Tax=Stutzerimonas kirkiae TaxID=2211392 RepID=A0A4Q9RFY1_9GAMM|nr:PilZ domain-containing protein [Stutzerimonas kirkiae]TBU99775.1 PilZ domain-containing protein [Stutzerimonas kirkiae]TBV05293.1 PilZ domain-containing protein [Stutzerimonas kirkiae]TBV15344.1 PilZ domain-containing protein [Stutzerimonas kirkiae]